MTPATTAGSMEAKWTRENVITAIQRWVECYGEPPRAADWNPSSAKWSNQLWRIERYRKGDPETGEAWPSLNAAKRPFNGSLNEALIAAGYEPARPGPQRQAGAPVRETVSPRELRSMETRARKAEDRLE